MVRISEIGLFTYIRRFGIPDGVEYRNSDFKGFNGNYLGKSCKNFVNFGPVTQVCTYEGRQRAPPSSISSLATGSGS